MTVHACKHHPDSPVPLPGLLHWRWGCVERGSCHEKERRESPCWPQLLLLLAASAPGPLACAWASSERPVQQLLLPGADRKGKAEGSSCLPRLSQVRLLEKGALQSRAAVPGEREGGWVGDMMLLVMMVGQWGSGRRGKSCWGGERRVRNSDPSVC